MTMVEELIMNGATNRFTTIGVQLQFAANNIQQALQRYEDSCTLCSMHGGRCSRTACPISRAFEHNVVRYQQALENPEIRKQVEWMREMG